MGWFSHNNNKKILNEILLIVKDLETFGRVFMATVQEQLDDVKASLDTISAGLDNVNTDVGNIAADEAKQTQMILDLQAIINGGGVITAEQLQPLVDQAKATQAKTDALASATKALADAIPD